MARSNQYHDVMLAPTMPKKRWPIRRRQGRYYPTGTRQMRDGRLEVTLYLPPQVQKQWQSALSSGKRIRLFVPQS